MFRRRLIIYGLFLLLTGTTFLLNAQNSQPEAQVEAEFYFAPLPSFNEMFSALDYLEIRDFDQALEEDVFRVTEDVYQVAFALGVNTADAIIATKARNTEKLNEIAGVMIEYAHFLGLSEEILRLGDELHEMIGQGEWDNLMVSLEKYREEVEVSLYESRQFDLFTLMQLGGWTQGLNRTAYMLMNNYNEAKTGIVAQKGILNSLINNLTNIKDKYLREQSFYAMSSELYQMIREIIYSQKELYTEKNIEDLFSHTQKVKLGFLEG
jgi:hypothetical protein